jgi:hypothetical protein
MRRTVLLLALASALISGQTSFAAEKKPEVKPGSSSFQLQPVALPVVINGRLANYIFVTLRLTLSPRADAEKLRAQEPFFRDALIRGAYSRPLHQAADPNRVNEAALRGLVLSESARIAGPGMVVAVQLTRAQPQHYLPKPTPAKPASAAVPVV